MHSISQQHGIKLKHLYKKNYLYNGQQPQVGEVLYMQKKRPKEDSVDIAEHNAWQDEEDVFVNPHSANKAELPEPTPIAKDSCPIPEYHVVEKGDNIYRIAEKYHVFEEDLLKWNKDLNPLNLKIGQKIYLSKEASMKYGNMNVTMKADSTNQKEQKLSEAEIDSTSKEITVDGPVFHLVVKGDTVYSICKRYGISQDQLKSWNKLEDITIYIGQKLQVSE
jgi:LysM repeat protein